MRPEERACRARSLPRRSPCRGTGTGPAAEEDAPEPRSPYAESKVAMEGLARVYAGTLGLPAACLRFFNVYGPRQSPNSDYAAVIPKFLEASLAGRPLEIHGD